MDKSIFPDKKRRPTDGDLKDSLGNTYPFWQMIREFVRLKYPGAQEEWNYPGEKYGWSFRMKDNKRAILYLLPRDHFFRVAFVFGQKATDEIMNRTISIDIKKELEAARVYAEGRGIRIDVKDEAITGDIKELISIKLLF